MCKVVLSIWNSCIVKDIAVRFVPGVVSSCFALIVRLLNALPPFDLPLSFTTIKTKF